VKLEIVVCVAVFALASGILIADIVIFSLAKDDCDVKKGLLIRHNGGWPPYICIRRESLL
jgi:hypothetical protein